ncbi:hypothetical protein SLE2022_270720 [Rubroshorea leprosula]
MSKHQLLLQWPAVLLLLFSVLFPLSHAEVGTTARYTPPYIPTACYGNDPSQLPSSNLFGAPDTGYGTMEPPAGGNTWEGVSIVLSSTAYGLIADASAASVNIEFKQ